VPDHQHLGPVGDDALDHFVVSQRADFRVEQFDVMAGVDQRPADREQAQRRQLLQRNAAADCDMRRIEQKNAHDNLEL
jgi:hypothetical protein